MRIEVEKFCVESDETPFTVALFYDAKLRKFIIMYKRKDQDEWQPLLNKYFDRIEEARRWFYESET